MIRTISRILFGVGITLSVLAIQRVQAAEVTTLTPAGFKEAINAKSGITLVEISTTNCDACKQLDDAKVLEKVGDKTQTKVYRITLKITGEDSASIPALKITDAPTLRILKDGAILSDIPAAAYAEGVDVNKVADNVTAAVNTAKGSASTTTNTITNTISPTVISNPPQADGKCHLVLVTIDVAGIKSVPTVDSTKAAPAADLTKFDCDRDISFYVYIKAFMDQLIPYVMLIALLMIIASGLQYMLSGVAGDTKAARGRILGVLGGVIFYFLIELILNQITPGLKLDAAPTNKGTVAPLTKAPITLAPGLDGSDVNSGTSIHLASMAVGAKNITYSYTNSQNNQSVVIGTASAPDFSFDWDTSLLDDDQYIVVASADVPSTTTATASFSLNTDSSEGDGGDLVAPEDDLYTLVKDKTKELSSLLPTQKLLASLETCYIKSHGTGTHGVPLYKQNKFCNIPYPHPGANGHPGALCDPGSKKCTIATSGCAIMAAQMVLEKYGLRDGSIQALANFAIENNYRYAGGTKIELFAAVAKKAGLKGGVIVGDPKNKSEAKWSKIMSFLHSGKPVILSGQGPAPFTSGGHFIVLTGIEQDGTIAVNDSAGFANRDNKTYSVENIKGHYNKAAIMYR